MKDKVKNLTKNTLIYGLGNAMNKFMGIFLIPLYAKLIPVEQFGVLAVFEMSLLFLSNIIPMGITNGHERYIIREKEKDEYPVFLFSNIVALFCLSFIILFIFSLLSNEMAFIISGDRGNNKLMVLVFIGLFFDINNLMPIHKLQYENKPIPYIAQNSFKLLISLSTAFYLISSLRYGIEGVFIGRILGSSSLFIWQLCVNILPVCQFKFDIRKVILAVKYGLPAVFSSLGFLLFLMSDRYLVNIYLGNSAAGKYAFGFRIASILLLLIQSIGISYLPTLFSHEKLEDNKRYYVKMLTYYTFAISWIIIGFIFFYKIPLWPLVKNKEYWDGLAIVPLLCFAFLFQGMTYFVSVGVSLTNKNRYLILPSLIIAAINILLNIYFLPKFGFVFAACCVLFSHILSVSVYSYFSNKFYKISFEWSKNLSTILLAVACIILGNIPWAGNDILFRLLLRIALLFSFPLILYRLGFFEKIELETIREKFKISIK